MGLIDIDDRDTKNIYNVYGDGDAENLQMPTQYKEWLGRLKAENPTTVINHLGRGIYKIDLAEITCIGADVETIFNIPFMHGLKKIETKHVDSAKADSANALAYSIAHRHNPNLWILLLSVAASTASDIVDEYIDYDLQAGEYKIITDSTNTELLYVSIYIKITGV